MSRQINVSELTPETRGKLGIRTHRDRAFTKESVRSWTIKVLAEIADLTQEQRRRVLEHAIKLNRV
jgi:hypothetical protein